MKLELETIVMELVVNGGNARSKALEAIQAAAKQDFRLAEKKMDECDETLQKAHEFQTGLIRQEASGESAVDVNLIMVHGQDHLMNAMTVRDLAKQMIYMYQIMYHSEEKKDKEQG